MSRRMIMVLVVVLLVLFFAQQNTEPIPLHFFWDFSVKAGYAVGVPFLIGIFVGMLMATRHHRKIQKTQQLPEPGSPVALLANVSATSKKKSVSWWW
jgi:uncharacterized integral membrane protein